MWRLLLLLIGCCAFSNLTGCAAMAQSDFWGAAPAKSNADSSQLQPAQITEQLVSAQTAPTQTVPIASTPSLSVSATSSDYKLGPGDKLTVTVFNEKGLSIEARLSDAGTLQFPLLGEIKAQGMTIGKLQDTLTDQLKNGYLVNPQVYVGILEYRQFFVNGEVNKPGGLPYLPGLTVRKAIALAGGFTTRASQTKIFIIRDDDSLGLPRMVNLDTVIRPGDIVTVNQSFF